MVAAYYEASAKALCIIIYYRAPEGSCRALSTLARSCSSDWNVSGVCVVLVLFVVVKHLFAGCFLIVF